MREESLSKALRSRGPACLEAATLVKVTKQQTIGALGKISSADVRLNRRRGGPCVPR